MQKEDLIKKISKAAKIKRADSNDIFDRVIELMAKELKKGKNVQIENFGEFKIVRNEMKIAIKKNKNKIVYPPKDTIAFVPAHELINRLNLNE